MNYEIVTQRWLCPECGSPIRLHFSQGVDEGEGPSDEYILDRMFCGMGHVLPDELWEEVRPGADQEFAAAMERGAKVAEIWCAPADTEDPTSPNENVPPED